jgi:hypothetical protein
MIAKLSPREGCENGKLKFLIFVTETRVFITAVHDDEMEQAG